MKKHVILLAVAAAALLVAACDAPPAEGTPKASGGEQTKSAPIKGGQGESKGMSPDMVQPTGVQPQTGSKVGGQ